MSLATCILSKTITGMNTSVIISTYNGAHKVLNLLKALERQSYQDFETVIVIDGSTDNTAQVINNASLSLSFLRVIEQENRGRAAVRNRGAETASGDLLIFFDDDMRPVPSCVEKHVLHHATYPRTILGGNPIEDSRRQTTDFQRYKASLSRGWVEPLRYISKPLHKDNVFLTAANFSVPKEVFVKIGGFDENMNDIEDLDFALRAVEKKVPIYFKYEAIAWHDDFVTCKSYVKRQVQYQDGLKVASQVSIYCRDYLVRQHIRAATWKKTFLSVICQNFMVDIIDKTRVLEFLLPKSLRYRFYSTLVWGFARHFPHRFKA